MFTITNDMITNGTSSLILKINQPPYNGICLLDNLEGTALQTYFTIKCSNWVDADGFITSYEFYG